MRIQHDGLGLGVICRLSLLLVLVLAPRGFSPGPPDSGKTNISKFQFGLDYCQALYYEPLAREIAQALPVLLILQLQLQRKKTHNILIMFDVTVI